MMELEIFDAFRSAGVAEDKARAAVASINSVIDKRYALHERQLFTKTDGAEMKADLLVSVTNVKTEMMKAMVDMQRWTLGALFAGMASVAAIVKLL